MSDQDDRAITCRVRNTLSQIRTACQKGEELQLQVEEPERPDAPARVALYKVRFRGQGRRDPETGASLFEAWIHSTQRFFTIRAYEAPHGGASVFATYVP